jgi:zinc transporter ZupT
MPTLRPYEASMEMPCAKYKFSTKSKPQLIATISGGAILFGVASKYLFKEKNNIIVAITALLGATAGFLIDRKLVKNTDKICVEKIHL